MEAALPYANVALFALQIVITWLSFSQTGGAQAQYETLITPAAYAFTIWNLIYFFTFMTVITDVAFPGLSIFNYAAKPTPLRVLFSMSCLFNSGWVLLFNNGLVDVATVDITLLWLVLLPLYLFLNMESKVRPMRWRQYLCSELSIRVYFSWITAATVVSWTITFQNLAGGFLSLAFYLSLLGVLVVCGLVGVVYGGDPVIGLVTVWACIGITQKELTPFPIGDEREKEVRVQAAATLAAGVVFAVVLVSVAEQAVRTNRHSRAWLTSLKVDADVESQYQYGAIASETSKLRNPLSRRGTSGSNGDDRSV